MYGVDCRGGYSTYSTNSNYACDLKKKKNFVTHSQEGFSSVEVKKAFLI